MENWEPGKVRLRAGEISPRAVAWRVSPSSIHIVVPSRAENIRQDLAKQGYLPQEQVVAAPLQQGDCEDAGHLRQ